MLHPPSLAHALAVALDPPPSFHRAIATDADGTLWAMDVGDALFLAIAAREAFVGNGLCLLEAHARRWLPELLAPKTSGGKLARALFSAYEQGAIPVRAMCDLEAETVGDRREDDFDALVDEVAILAARSVRTEIRAFLQDAHAQGVAVHVVSGSLAVLVEQGLLRAGIPFDRVTGAVLTRSEGRVQAAIAQKSPLFEGKVTALAAGGAWPAAVGMGDGGWDHTFLRLCAVPVLVHPKQALVDALHDASGVVRIG